MATLFRDGITPYSKAVAESVPFHFSTLVFGRFTHKNGILQYLKI